MSQQADLPGQADIIGAEHARASFEDYVTASSGRLFTMALLLTGYNRAEAEDLLQSVLERAHRRWPRIGRSGHDPGPYVRKMLVNASVDRWRLLRRRPEEPLAAASAVPAGGDEAALLAERDQLLRAMAALPAGQRAVLVLRYFEDLSEAQAAAALGCSVGSVKSQSARALARLRTVVGAPDEPDDRSPDSRRQEGGRRHARS